MSRKRIALQEGSSLEIVGGEGDLSIQGSNEAALLIEPSGKAEVVGPQEAGRVVLSLEGDTRLQLWRTTPVTVRRLEGDLRGHGLEGPVEIHDVHGDVSLHSVGEVRLAGIDGDISLHSAGQVLASGYLGGDVTLHHVGAVELGEVGGDLTVRGAASLSSEHAGDDVSASAIRGDIRLKEVRGDLTLRNVEGGVDMGRVGGDLTVRNLRGDLMVPRVDGDISLHIAFQEGRRYNLAGHRKILVRFPEGTAARFYIQAPRWSCPKEGAFEVETQEEGRAVVRLGQGGPDVYLTCDGEVVLGTPAGDWERSWHAFGLQMEAWGEEFGRQMEEWGEQMRRNVQQVDWQRIGEEIQEATARVTQVVESRLQEIDLDEMSQRVQRAAEEVGGRVKEVDWQRIGHKVEQAVQQGVAKAQAGLQKLQERLQQQAAGSQTKPAGQGAGAQPAAEPAVEAGEQAAAAPAEQASAGATDEERLAVLRLLEEGRLTAEEAAALLDALEH